MSDPNPNTPDAHEITTALHERLPHQSRPVLAEAVAYVLDQTTPTTIKGLQDITSTSRPTATKYRNLILSGIEHGPYSIADFKANPTPAPTPRHLAAVAIEAAAQAQGQRTLHTKNSPDFVSSEDVLKMIDRTLTRLDTEKAPATQIKQMLELKIKYQDLTPEQLETHVDTRKLLGPDGIAALGPSMADRFATLIIHRHEIPQIYHDLTRTILRALDTDITKSIPLPPDLHLAVCDLASRLSLPATGEASDSDIVISDDKSPDWVSLSEEEPLSGGTIFADLAPGQTLADVIKPIERQPILPQITKAQPEPSSSFPDSEASPLRDMDTKDSE